MYVHEGLGYDESNGNRRKLVNTKYFGGVYEKPEDLWLEVSKYINEQYDVDKIETIYLSGDGASWIKTGLDWLPKSIFVLDNYHMQKYIKQATGHLDNDIRQELRDAIDWADKEDLKKVFNKILKQTEEASKYNSVKNCRRYFLNNWEGIKIKAEKEDEIVGCRDRKSVV